MISDVMELLENEKMTRICAPMVRYSKLQFRSLVRRYNCDICFTPMILADSFVQSSKARDNEFTTNRDDKPLIVQFAAKNADDFVQAAGMIAPYSNGVDLNCGCPQRWAMKEGYGAHLLKEPQVIKDLINQVRNHIPKPFTVSVKIRLLKNLKEAVNICQTIEKAGASFLTIHARTPEMRNEPIDLEGLKILRDSVRIPVIANGAVKTLDDALHLKAESRCNGVMSAGGILTNPTLFSGSNLTTVNCIQDWLDITSAIPTSFLTFHHHLVFMLEKVVPKAERKIFNVLQDRNSVLNFIEDYFNLTPNVNSSYESTPCVYESSNKCAIVKNEDLNNEGLSDLFLENLFD